MARNSQETFRKRGPRFKLDCTAALQMKDRYDSGEATVDEIARQYGVTKQTIYNTMARIRNEVRS
jgi:hypothetical protein